MALQWLMSYNEPKVQVSRWLEELQSYNLTVVPRVGSNYANTDALCHLTCAAEGCITAEKRDT